MLVTTGTTASGSGDAAATDVSSMPDGQLRQARVALDRSRVGAAADQRRRVQREDGRHRRPRSGDGLHERRDVGSGL
jgi:hypothetical protein